MGFQVSIRLASLAFLISEKLRKSASDQKEVARELISSVIVEGISDEFGGKRELAISLKFIPRFLVASLERVLEPWRAKQLVPLVLKELFDWIQAQNCISCSWGTLSVSGSIIHVKRIVELQESIKPRVIELWGEKIQF